MTARPARPAARPALRAAAALGLAVPLLAGCSVTNSIATQDDSSVTDGVRVDLGPVRAGNVLVVATDDGRVGTVVGYLTNSGTDAAEVAVGTGDDGAATVRVPAGGTVLLGPDHEEVTVRSVTAPGGTVDLVLAVEGGRTTTVPAPVLDGTLPEYADLVPDAG